MLSIEPLEHHSIYDANFTAGGLMLESLDRLAPVLLGIDVEQALREESENNSFVGIKTLGARKRILSEVARRYRVAPTDFWRWYFERSAREKALASYFLCMKAYRLVFDLHHELALRKFRIGSELKALDVEQFLDLLGGKDEYVGGWSEETLKKLNTQFRKALKDANLLRGDELVAPSGIPVGFWDYFKEQKEDWFLEACFQN